MNFLRSLLGTIMVAAFGAIVLAGTAPLAEPASLTTAQAFAWVFYADAGCIAIALFAVALMAERPLQEEP